MNFVPPGKKRAKKRRLTDPLGSPDPRKGGPASRTPIIIGMVILSQYRLVFAPPTPPSLSTRKQIGEFTAEALRKTKHGSQWVLFPHLQLANEPIADMRSAVQFSL